MMSAVTRSLLSVEARDEQLIGALLPDLSTDPVVIPPPLPTLPALTLPAGPDGLLLDVAVLDRSGRFSARGLLAALGWRPGHGVRIDAVHGVVVIGPAVAGRSRVGARGDLALPAPIRALCGIAVGDAVVLTTSLSE